jgi:hypothetical protein
MGLKDAINQYDNAETIEIDPKYAPKPLNEKTIDLEIIKRDMKGNKRIDSIVSAIKAIKSINNNQNMVVVLRNKAECIQVMKKLDGFKVNVFVGKAGKNDVTENIKLLDYLKKNNTQQIVLTCQ